MMQFRPFILALAALAAGVSTFTAISPALASERGVLVSYDDLNLGSRAGRAMLESRIERAAEIVCGTANPTELDIAAGVAACREDAIASARAQVAALARGESLAALRVGRAVRAAD
jgi:UrcA family protein